MSFSSPLNKTGPIAYEWPYNESPASAQARSHLQVNSTVIATLLVFIPFLAIALNVARQLVVPRRSTDPPTVFHWLPFIGSAISYGNDPLNFFFECQKKYGDVFTFILFGRRMTVALGPKGNNFILGGKSTVFNAEDAYTHLTTPIFGKGVVYDVPNEVFMEQKKFAKAGFSTDNLRKYADMIEDEIHTFLSNDASFKTYQDGGTDEWGYFDSVRVMQEITILTASRTLQGREVRESLNKSFAELFNDLDGGFTPLNFMFPNLPLPSYRRRDRAHLKMSEFYVGIIQQRRRGQVDNQEQDMISILMNQKYRNGKSFEDHEIAHLMIAMLMAGQHTSSASGSWALLHIANRPDIGEALYQEQVKNFATPDGGLRPLTYEELRKLPLLDSVIRETLRVHPPIHSIMRYVREDVPIPPTLAAPSGDKDRRGVYIVPKGNFVLSSPAVSQADPAVWKDASMWDPYRWTDSEGAAAQALRRYSGDDAEKVDYGFGVVSKGTESSYLPFGAGKHRCIGEQFSYLQLGALIATIIRAMELRIDTVPEQNYHTMITMPKCPRNISYRRRK